MADKSSTIKLYSFTYGKGVCITMLVAAAGFVLLGAFLLPNIEGICMMLVGLLFVVIFACLIYFKYLHYITLTDKSISTKKQTFLWNDVNITMSLYLVHPSIRREDYYIFFDDHYLNKEEIYSHKVRSNAFYLMVTPKRLEIIFQRYGKKIQLLERSKIDRKGLYEQVEMYNQSLTK